MSGAVGIVVIGRNEGERLVSCLRSLGTHASDTIYVDSGSTDGSRENAGRLGAMVVELDMATPFTAARARNAGLAALVAARPDVAFVQFIDGDCDLDAGWLPAATRFLAGNTGVAIVCGRRRERNPQASVYNGLCDREWDTPVGDALACGGDCLARVDALSAAGGYAADLIAGEEPELCVRLRAAGWRIHRLDAEMTLHDANITRFGQWWSRARRAGHAFAEVADRHRNSRFGIWGRNVRSAVTWGAILPAVTVLAGLFVHPAAWALLLVYPLQVARIGRRERGQGAWPYALFIVLAKFPETQGILRFYLNRARGRRQGLIEYK